MPLSHDKARLENYSRGLFPELVSNKSVKKSIKNGALLVNGEQKSTGYYVQSGDEIQLYDLELTPPKPYEMDLDVVYEDQDLAVVYKPAGLITSGNQFRTLENVVVGKIMVSGEGALKWPKPIHRLDAATSGLVVVAKSVKARVELGRMLEDKSISKKYVALVAGAYEGPSVIDQPINNSTATTKVEIIKQQESLNNDIISMLGLYPETGRTHQLRIHLAGQGNPIIGDVLYGEKGNTLLHKGLYLCAVGVSFIHPVTNDVLNIEVDVPEKFNKLMEREYKRFLKYKK